MVVTLYTIHFNKQINGKASKDFKTYKGVLRFAEKNGLTSSDCRLYYVVKDSESGKIYQAGFTAL